MNLCGLRKFLVMFVFAVALTLVVQAASPSDAFVKDVAFNAAGRSLEARITASESARFTYFELDGPHRLVIDFHGLKNGISFTQKDIEAAGVTRVRASYFTSPERAATRIVFDLDPSVNYRVVDDGEGVVRVVFVSPDALLDGKAPTNLIAGPPMLPKAEETSSVLPKVRLESLTEAEVTGLQQAETVVAAAAAAATPVAVTPSASPVVTVAQAPAIPTAPVTVTVAQAAPAVRAPAPQAAPPQTATQQLSPRISLAQGPQAPAVTGPAEQQTFNGEIIDLDLKQADYADFFRLIGEISGLNVVVDQNVTGTVTVSLKDLPWDEALDIVLRNNNLGGILEGRNVLRIATRATLQAEDAQRKAARDAQAALIPPLSRNYVLNYTKASDVSTTLLASGVLSSKGRVAVEPRRNAIIVTDAAEQFDGITKMIEFIDTQAPQVEIEARLVAANKSFSRELGAQIGLLVGANTGNIVAGATGEVSPFTRPGLRTPPGGTALPLLTNLGAAATSGVGFILQPGANILLDTIITAAEASGTARLLSQPKVMAENNTKAEIEQGTKIPVQTNVNNTITTTFLTFALKLDVTPQISDNGSVLMEIDIENSQPDFARTVNGVPAVSTQHARTRNSVPDGATMMIGGIFVDTDSLNIRQVPAIGSIPIIGHLFKNTQTIKSQAELFFFITPRIKKVDAVATSAPRN